MKSCDKHGWIDTSDHAEGCPSCRILGEEVAAPGEFETVRQLLSVPTRDEIRAYLEFVQKLYLAFPEREAGGAELLLSVEVNRVQAWLKGLI